MLLESDRLWRTRWCILFWRARQSKLQQLCNGVFEFLIVRYGPHLDAPGQDAVHSTRKVVVKCY